MANKLSENIDVKPEVASQLAKQTKATQMNNASRDDLPEEGLLADLLAAWPRHAKSPITKQWKMPTSLKRAPASPLRALEPRP